MSNKSSGQQVQYWYHRLEERCIYLCVEEYIPLRIAELCRKRGYTKYRLAQLTGITQTALGNMLNQKSMPTMANLEKMKVGSVISKEKVMKIQSHNFFQMMKADWI